MGPAAAANEGESLSTNNSLVRQVAFTVVGNTTGHCNSSKRQTSVSPVEEDGRSRRVTVPKIQCPTWNFNRRLAHVQLGGNTFDI